MKRVAFVTIVFTLTMIATAGTATAAPSAADAGVSSVGDTGGEMVFDWECETTSVEGEVYMFCANDNTGETYSEHLYSK